MDFDDFSDDEEREARMYAMLHFVDGEVTNNTATISEIFPEKENINTSKCLSDVIIDNVEKENINVSKTNDDMTQFDRCSRDTNKNNEITNFDTSNGASNCELSKNDNIDNTKNNVKTVKKKVSHAGRYWASAAESTRNSPYQKINNPGVNKNSATSTVTDKKFGSVITLNDKRAFKQKSSEHSNSVSDGGAADSQIEQNDTTESPQLVIGKTTNKRLSSTPINKPSKKKSSQTLSKTAKNLSTPNKNIIPVTPRSKVNFGVKVKLRSETLRKGRSEREKLLAEISLKNKYAAAKKLYKTRFPFEKSSIITLESSDDDSVVEVELPRIHPTTIELDSSDEGLDLINSNSAERAVELPAALTSTSATQTDPNIEHHRVASPVPSIVSSISDDFIEGDCSSLNISRGFDTSNFSFNFGLHGTDLCDLPADSTPRKSNKKSRKNCSTSTESEVIIQKTTSKLTTLIESGERYHVNVESSKETSPAESECFATPRSKIKKRRNSKPKSYTVPDQAYVTPSIDVYESESSDIPESIVDVPVTPISKRNRKSFSEDFSRDITIEKQFTDISNDIIFDSTADIINTPRPFDNTEDSLVMANVIGLPSNSSVIHIDGDTSDVGENNLEVNEASLSTNKKPSKLSKTKKHAFLEKCVKQMHEYYNTIRGKEFDHLQIKMDMPREKDFWRLDASDKGRPRKSQIMCGYCNKAGHRPEKCYKKPKVCSMCGEIGHLQLRCPNKICLGCGVSSNSFSSTCDNCKRWRHAQCSTCGVQGHPPSRCPDIWRRYHLTIENEVPLIQDKGSKPTSQLFCSGCTKRGHLITHCHEYIAFSEFNPPSPYVFSYKPVYTPDGVRTPGREKRAVEGMITKNNPQSPGKRKLPSFSTPKVSEPTSSVSLKVLENNSNPKIHTVSVKPDTKSTSMEFNITNQSECLLNTSSINVKQPDPNLTKDVINILNNDSEFLWENSSTQNTMLEKSKALEQQKCNSSTLREQAVVQLNSTNLPKTVILNDSDAAVINNSNLANAKEENNSTSHILLTQEHANKLETSKGLDFMKYLSNKYDVVARKCTLKVGVSLALTGTVEKHLNFQSELQSWMNFGNVPIIPSTPYIRIPRKRKALMRLISAELGKLKCDLGKPQDIYQSILEAENSITKCGSKEKVNSERFLELCKKVTKFRKLLNMILIGQAGLCDGQEMLKKLEYFLDHLSTLRGKVVGLDLRDEIEQYFNPIFSGAPRDDYLDLINQFLSENLPHSVKSFRPKTLQIQKSLNPSVKKNILSRLQVTFRKLRIISRNWNHDPNIRNVLDYLVECKRSILEEQLPRSAVQEIRVGVESAHRYMLSFNTYKGRA